MVATCKKAKAKREKTDGFSPKQEGGKIKVNPLAVKRSRVFTASSSSFSDANEGGREGGSGETKQKTYNVLLLSLPSPLSLHRPPAMIGHSIKKSCGTLRAKSAQGTHMGEQQPLLQVKKHWRFIFSFSSAAHFRPFMYRFEVKKKSRSVQCRQAGRVILILWLPPLFCACSLPPYSCRSEK